MRMKALSALPLLLLCALPVQAQNSPDRELKQLNNRLGAIESQLRAVQREVFPGGDKRYFKPEITPDTATPDMAGTNGQAGEGSPASLLTDFGQRLTDMEHQQRELTGKIEELQHRLSQLEARSAAGGREDGTTEGNTPILLTTPEGTDAPKTDDPEAAYRQAHDLYTSGQYATAATALEKFVAAYPKHARASDAQFWAGRALLEQGDTADAAKAFLRGYQEYPKGARAHDSLLWLSRSLIKLNQPSAACQSLDQLKASYPDRLTGQFAADVTAERAKAKCSG